MVGYHIDSGYSSQNYGARSCDTFGDIYRIVDDHENDSDECQDVDPVQWIDTEAFTWDGDSGSPHWGYDGDQDTNRLYGIQKGTNRDNDDDQDTFNFSRMSPGFALHDDENIDFVNTDSC